MLFRARSGLAKSRERWQDALMPEKRLPLLEAAGHDLMAQVEAMLRQVRHYQRAVMQIREVFDHGRRDRASLLLAEGPVLTHMEQLRKESLGLVETIESIELFVKEERASRL
jgi:hypothetical protein